jgi:hypothetical protein
MAKKANRISEADLLFPTLRKLALQPNGSLGKPANLTNQLLGCANGRAVRSKQAIDRASDIAPIIADIRAAGASSLRYIAVQLNQRGIPAARGGQRSAVQVKRASEKIWGRLDSLKPAKKTFPREDSLAKPESFRCGCSNEFSLFRYMPLPSARPRSEYISASSSSDNGLSSFAFQGASETQK